MAASDKGIAGPHIVRFGIAAEKDFLLEPFDKTYDQLIINASTVAHMPGALALFVAHRAKKPYLIDPQTHSFQHDISYLLSDSRTTSGELKRPYKVLAKKYGDPVKSNVADNHSPVLPESFKDQKTRRSFCSRVIRYQRQALGDEVKKSDSAKYYAYLEQKTGTTPREFGPSMVVAPYFYMKSNTLDEWLDINVGCAADSRTLVSRGPLGVQIVMSKDILCSEGQRERVVKEYKKALKRPPESFLLWIDDLPEDEASKDELVALRKLFRALGQVAPVVNLYGGSLSVSLMQTEQSLKMAGVAHGLEYGEHRGVLPVSGGPPISKFYLPALHSRIPAADAIRAIRALGGQKSVAEFRENICDCSECKNVIEEDVETSFRRGYGSTREVAYLVKGQPYVREIPLPETRRHCVRHYMWCKQKEYSIKVSRLSLASTFQETREKLKGALGPDKVAHLRVWAEVLSEDNAE